MGHANIKILAMRPQDISDVIELETGDPSAWSWTHLEDELQQPAGFQFVTKDEATGKVLAVICGRLMADEAEILKISVAEHERKRGIGDMLLDFAMKHCRSKGVKNCFLELRRSNTAARSLYEKRGFSIIGSRRKYYKEPLEDAIMMQFNLLK